MNFFSQLMISFVFASVVSFVLLNIVVQCETWEDPACVTPSEFIMTAQKALGAVW